MVISSEAMFFMYKVLSYQTKHPSSIIDNFVYLSLIRHI